MVPANGIKHLYGIWNWDTAFHVMALSHVDVEIAKENVLAFLKFQNEDSMLPDVVRGWGEIDCYYSKPPVMPWAAKLAYEQDHDLNFLKEIYPNFVAYEKFLSDNRSQNGMFYYDVTCRLTEH